jgi:hypothetical protein
MKQTILSQEGCKKEVSAFLKKLEGKKQGNNLLVTPPKAAFYLERIMKIEEAPFISHIAYVLEKYPTLLQPEEKYLIRLSLFVEEKQKEKVEAFLERVQETYKGWCDEKKLYEKNHGFQVDLFFKGEAL